MGWNHFEGEGDDSPKVSIPTGPGGLGQKWVDPSIAVRANHQAVMEKLGASQEALDKIPVKAGGMLYWNRERGFYFTPSSKSERMSSYTLSPDSLGDTKNLYWIFKISAHYIG